MRHVLVPAHIRVCRPRKDGNRLRILVRPHWRLYPIRRQA